MTTFEAVTTYPRKYWTRYARRCVRSFTQHWEASVLLRTFDDARLEAESPWLKTFKERNAHRSVENYRFDAVRFAHKVAAIELAFKHCTKDVLIWIDADCVTHSYVAAEWLDSLIGAADFAYLKRKGKYPECGFMMFRRNAACQQFIDRIVEMYSTDMLFKLNEWHDSFVIEHVRRSLTEWGALLCASLSGDAEDTGHPFVNGPLGAKMDHLKGSRKELLRSRTNDLKRDRPEAYWKVQA